MDETIYAMVISPHIMYQRDREFGVDFSSSRNGVGMRVNALAFSIFPPFYVDQTANFAAGAGGL